VQVTCARNNFAKKHVWLSIETRSRISYTFGIKPKYPYTIMYECEKSPLMHELFYVELFNFSHLSLFHVNVICQK